MRKVEVCLSPDLLHLYDISEKTVVIVDILRATSCMVAGIASGVKSIAPFADLEECFEMKVKGYITAGERGGQKVEGFDIGNSPFSYMEEPVKGKSIAVTTTNGTRAIALSKGAPQILIGSFLNISSTEEYLFQTQRDVLILCAAWKGRVNLEDTLFAGALAGRLLIREFITECDATLASSQLFQKAANDLAGTLAESSHVKRLKNFGIEKDIEFCLRIDEFNVVAGLVDNEIVKLV